MARFFETGDPKLVDIPVLVISADAGVHEKGARLGAVESMVKPIELSHLRDTVATHC